MRKLILLLLLIPVLSWADCPGATTESTTITRHSIYTLEETKYYENAVHCEAHRCQKEIEELHKKFPERKGINEVSASCLCGKLGGARNPSGLMKGYFSCYEMKIQKPKSSYIGTHFATEPKPKSAPVTPQPKTSITDAKSQCSDIGFKKGTEKFGECVLELMQ